MTKIKNELLASNDPSTHADSSKWRGTKRDEGEVHSYVSQIQEIQE